MAEYGYARVSSRDQNESRQLIALQEAGILPENIYMDKQSGKDFDRPAWKKLKRKLRRGDVLYIKSLDRMGRDYRDVQEQWRALNKGKGVDLVILDMPLLDTRADKNLVGTLISDIVLQLLAFVAQTERENIHQRQAEGIAAAKARGVKFGRPSRQMPPEFEAAYQRWISGSVTLGEAAAICGLPRSSFRSYAINRKPDGVPLPPTIRREKRPPPPEHFEEVYRGWSSGGMSASDAALLLGIPVARFRAYAKETQEKEGALMG